MITHSSATRAGEKLPVTRLFHEMITRSILPDSSRSNDTQVNMYLNVLLRMISTLLSLVIVQAVLQPFYFLVGVFQQLVFKFLFGDIEAHEIHFVDGSGFVLHR